MERDTGIGELGEIADLAEVVIPHEKSKVRWTVEVLITVGVVALMFVIVIPAAAGSQYHDVWKKMQEISWQDHLLIFGAWVVNIVNYAPVLVSVTPGLRWRTALTANLASSAVSNVLPFGGAAGVGATFLIYRSWGIGPATTTRSVLLSGIWNVFLKFGLPVLALFLLVGFHDVTLKLLGIAAIGAVALAVSILGFALVIRSDALARAVGRIAERIVSVFLRVAHKPAITTWEDRLVHFRHESADLVRKCWKRTTFWMVTYNVTQFGVLWACLVATGVDTSPAFTIKAFAAFAFGRLLSAIPITPSGLGFVEAGLAAALRAAGGDPAGVTAAVLLFSAYTYLIELPTGAIAWGVWAGKKSWRAPVADDVALGSA